MLYQSSQMEENAILATAARMCAAARTAPKTRGIDNIVTLVLTGDDKNALADKMLEVADREYGEKPCFFRRDAKNVRDAGAVVMIGVKTAYAGLPYCSFCGFKNCAECKANNKRCAFTLIDLGIAVSSAVSVAADDRTDNRVMFSIGKTAEDMPFAMEGVIWQGIPISVTGKSIFFDRQH